MTRYSLLFLPLLLLGALEIVQTSQATTAQTQSQSAVGIDALAPEQKTRIEQLAKLQKHFGKDMNSPGVDLSLKEIGRPRIDDRSVVQYELYATGFRANSNFTLFQVQMDGSTVKRAEGVTLDKNGRAICGGEKGKCQGNGPDDPVVLVVSAAIGEPKRFILVSDDTPHSKGFVSVTPYPNAAIDGNCRLESVLGSENGELIFIQGSGFAPSAELAVDIQSYDEKHQQSAKAGVDGSYFATLMPYVKGKKFGKTIVRIRSKTCNPTISFEWGENSYHPE
jgi:hypothetical protein